MLLNYWKIYLVIVSTGVLIGSRNMGIYTIIVLLYWPVVCMLEAS